MEAVFTMTPPPCFSNTGITARIPRIGAVRFVEITLSQISSLTSPAGRSSSKTPALLTRISIRPNRPKAEFIIRCTSSSLVTSTSTGVTSDWFCCNVSAIFLTSIPLMSAGITFAPSLANKTAIAFPLPDAAPVTIATLSFSLPEDTCAKLLDTLPISKINVTINFNILMFLFFCAKLNVMEMKIIVFLYHKHGKISYVERKSISAG